MSAAELRILLEAVAELRILLEAVREAIAIPYAATVGDAEERARVLTNRAMYAEIVLGPVLDHGEDPGWSADYLRGRLAEHPATGYRHWGTASTRAGQQNGSAS
ncbi:hypothetical protein [Streptomyces roseolilacinus]|uniref:Uncharacterized protein n=1 Tax=Streptomyces roseolilacinus TaxID=66904 RepID=A0A918EKB7_9ACTN|nr:hypothetical protein [Streptomyces roseolilacinus]GGQ12774.1 hypothetical protein GCM10010249_34270 [Streptomyces roseolilacinus]